MGKGKKRRKKEQKRLAIFAAERNCSQPPGFTPLATEVDKVLSLP